MAAKGRKVGELQPSQVFYAHSLLSSDRSQWERLEDHLASVASLAQRFAGVFGFSDLGYLAGFWHDVGKYRSEFQERIKGKAIAAEHAGAGAALADPLKNPAFLPLSFAIAGHHAGLANFKSNESASQLPYFYVSRRPLLERLEAGTAVLDAIRPVAPPEILGAGQRIRSIAPPLTTDDLLRSEILTRFLFSALVDADRLATAEFYAKHAPAPTHDDLVTDSIPVLLDRLRGAQTGFNSHDPVNSIRREILSACIAAADHPTGCFSLTAPTGGGKTLSSMRFALEHAVKHDLRRVIVVIPYTSIIEQNAKVYRGILGDDNVLEHHSNLDDEKLHAEDSERETRRKLAAENWGSPIVVTTSVQFFESLFSDHPSRCRKLHNIARSVIILDEIQTLPPDLLHPILEMLKELTTPRYGCSIVLSTATPPSLTKRADLPFGLDNVRPILPGAARLIGRARRVKVRWEVDEPTPYEELAPRLAALPRVLAIVHRRDDARQLAELIEQETGGEELFHLSAAMCPAHRLRVLAAIRERLEGKGPCRVISTQLVEAGVDLDFPVVYRSLAGLDSLAQAAGRCDREGRLTQANRAGGLDRPGGELVVFRSVTEPPPGVLKQAAQTMHGMLAEHGEPDIFDPRICETFFNRLYRKADHDEKKIQLHRKNLDFLTTSLCFKMIDGDTRPVVARWGEGSKRIERFKDDPTRRSQRALQPFVVQVRSYQLDSLLSNGVVEFIHDRVHVLSDLHHEDQYHPVYGLAPKADGVIEPGRLNID